MNPPTTKSEATLLAKKTRYTSKSEVQIKLEVQKNLNNMKWAWYCWIPPLSYGCAATKVIEGLQSLINRWVQT